MYVPGDETALSMLLRRTLKEVNSNYCPKDEIDWLYARYTPETVACLLYTSPSPRDRG